MAVLTGIVPVFLLIGLGALLRRLAWADSRFVRDLNRIIFWFAIPALLLRLLGKAHLGTSFSPRMAGACVAATIVSGCLALAFALAGRQAPYRRGVIVQAAVRGNLVYMGFPVIFALGGPRALTIAAVTVAVLIPVQNLIAVVALAQAGSRDFHRIAAAVLLNPVVIGVLGGVLWAMAGWQPWPWLDNFLRLLGNIAMPGALIAVGAQMELKALRANTGTAVLTTVLKVVMAPAAGLLLLHFLGVGGLPRTVGILLLAAPTAVASAAVAQEMGGDLDLAGACVMAATLASLPAYLLWGLLVAG